ncbi:MAG: Amuc_1102 family pilus-like protein [Chthoniobacterales bacterium]
MIMTPRYFPALLLLACLAPLAALAQQPNTEFQITKITPDLVTTPEYSISNGPKNKKVSKNKDFVELEVAFDWQPRAKEPRFLDDLTLNYYVLLNDKSRENPKGTLLTGSVTHSAIPQGKGMNSVMYISPRTLERFFEGKAPSTINGAIVDVGVTITKQGQLVAEQSWKGKGQWWSTLQQVNGYVLNKNETPFAPLAWDYYEAIKARPAGM